ncbi:ABC transporter ATP-binding protein [Alkalihalobacillus oceani]|uniref:ABC transporter ATP-binding protein n=1 Tax=Halalkalibacter oceani TaxID=1653776 RepID=UPI00203BD65B|nr:ABC transporter ATP-binding protein [Halalkalibacter oceani]MCM3761079.1 ABC transporter ATP-binding protein [Halalkalibacter oceani]
MAKIVLKNVTKAFDETQVVKGLNVTIKDGSFTVLVGPSGCGKSTTLRMIAGLEKQTGGDIWIGDRCVNEVPPGKRNIAMVFQNYALYPTMTVKENIEFGLINKKVPKAERKKLINEISEIVGLTEYLKKKPQHLSGGQRQRVALARAMVKKPQVFILDEPLSNLDAKLRNQMRTELIELHKRLGTTFVYVTHDQVEAMSMGDEIILLNKGEIQQVDSPMKMYRDPNNTFTAEFIGTPAMNVVEYQQVRMYLPDVNLKAGYIGFRPEVVQLSGSSHHDNQLVIPGEIVTRETLGAEIIYKVKTGAGFCRVKQFQTNVEEATTVYLTIPLDKLYFFDKDGIRMRHVSIGQKPLVLEGV